MQTFYIGTHFAESLRESEPRPSRSEERPRGLTGATRPNTGVLRLVYLGYMRLDKGFYFYLKALKKMPAPLARRLALTFAAKIADPIAYQNLKRMAHRFASVTYYDGYTHSQLADILSGIDLAVVPVLWEDNLPQVAMECVASGVPILTSDRGGAQELLSCRDLVFEAGSRTDFHAKIQNLLDNPEILSTALAGRSRLYTPARTLRSGARKLLSYFHSRRAFSTVCATGGYFLVPDCGHLTTNDEVMVGSSQHPYQACRMQDIHALPSQEINHRTDEPTPRRG